MNEPFSSELVSWTAVRNLSRKLAGKIRDDGFRPGLVVAVARGGYVPARLLCDYLDIHELSSIQIVHYAAGAKKKRQARLVEIPSRNVHGRNVLLVDDVNDTGDTLELAREHFANAGVRSLRIAVLHHKISSSMVPDYYAQKIIKWRWLIYPWAIYEDVNGFIDRLPRGPAEATDVVKLLEKYYGLRVDKELVEEIFALRD